MCGVGRAVDDQRLLLPLHRRFGLHDEHLLRRHTVVDRTRTDHPHLHGRGVPRAVGSDVNTAFKSHLEIRRTVFPDVQRRAYQASAATRRIGTAPHLDIADTQVNALLEFVVIGLPPRSDEGVIGLLPVACRRYAVPVGFCRKRRRIRPDVIGSAVYVGHPRKIVLEIDVTFRLAVVAADLESNLLSLAEVALVKAEVVDAVTACGGFDLKIERGIVLADPKPRQDLFPVACAVDHFVLQGDQFVAAVPNEHPEPVGRQFAAGSQHAHLQTEIGVVTGRHVAHGKRGNHTFGILSGSLQHDIVTARSLVVARRRRVGRHESVYAGESHRRSADAFRFPRRIAAHGDRLRNGRSPGPGADVVDKFIGGTLRHLDLCGHAVQRIEPKRRRTPAPGIHGRGDLHRLVAVRRTGRDGQPVGIFVEIDHPIDIRQDIERDIAAFVGHSTLVGADRRSAECERLIPGPVRTAGPGDQRRESQQPYTVLFHALRFSGYFEVFTKAFGRFIRSE